MSAAPATYNTGTGNMQQQGTPASFDPQVAQQQYEAWQQYYSRGGAQPAPQNQQIQQHSGQESVAYKAFFDQPAGATAQQTFPQPQAAPMAQHYGQPPGRAGPGAPISQYGQAPAAGNAPPPQSNPPVFPPTNLAQGRPPAAGGGAWGPPAPAQRGAPQPLMNAFVGGPPPGNYQGMGGAPPQQSGGYGGGGGGMDPRSGGAWIDRRGGGGGAERRPYNRGPGDYTGGGTPGGQAGYREGSDRHSRDGGGSYDRGGGGNYRGGGGSGGYGQEQSSKNILFFSGLPSNANEQFIHDVFSMEQGDVELNLDGRPKIKIYKDAGQSKGECTITFRSEEVAQRVINTYNGQPFPGSEGTMNISFAKFGGGKGGGGGRPPFDGGRGSYGGGRDYERGGGGGRDGGRGGGGGAYSRGPPGGGRDGGGGRGRGGFGGGGGGRGGFGQGGDRGGRKGGLEMRKGDWSCPCGNINFAFRRECNSCKSPKPQDGAGDDGGYRGPPTGGYSGGGPMRYGGGGGYGGAERSRPY